MNLIHHINQIRSIITAQSVDHIEPAFASAFDSTAGVRDIDQHDSYTDDRQVSLKQINQRQTARQDQLVIKQIRPHRTIHIILDINTNRHHHIRQTLYDVLLKHIQGWDSDRLHIILRSPVSLKGTEVTHTSGLIQIWRQSIDIINKNTDHYQSILPSVVPRLTDYQHDAVVLCSDFCDYDQTLLDQLKHIHHIVPVYIPISVIGQYYRARELKI